MGQKVNPVIIRQSIPNFKSNTSIWFSRKNTYRSLLFQDLEIINFINFLFKTWGIFIRNYSICRNNNMLCLSLDLYFNYKLAKERLFLERKNFFYSFQKTIPVIYHPKVMKEFIYDLTYYNQKFIKKFMKNMHQYFKKFYKLQKIFCFQNIFYTFFTKLTPFKILKFKKTKKINLKTFKEYKKEKNYKLYIKKFIKNFNIKTLKYKNFLFAKRKKYIYVLQYYEKYLFLFFCEYKKLYPLKKDIFPYIVKRSNLTILKKIFLSKLHSPVYLKKFSLNFFKFYFKNTCTKSYTKFSPNFLSLHNFLCKSLHNYTGNENINIKFYSTQLYYMPSLRFYLRFFLKDLFFFKKNKILFINFYNVIEIVYFVLSTFGIGNAKILAYHISYLLENTRKHLDVIKFLKKVIDLYFIKIPKLLAVNGIRVLVTGRFNKRQRSKSILIQKGEICLHTFTNFLDYYQVQAVTFCGSFGIKVWFSR
uniref:30S ribosomal protein S3 n=1 Tax=Vischeria cf. polyphem TaxID=1132302 RepID=A0A5J6Y341_9STRA|nr:30S ribosomal protein S3 [Eustigmatos cf. polyphem]